MKKKLLAGLITGVFLFGMVGMVNADTIINNSTCGYYNSSIGTLLDFTNPYGGTYLFPGANSNPSDPTLEPVPFEPDLSSASTSLGNWLTDPTNLNSNWSSSPQSIPATWTVNTETAIIYEIDAGTNGLDNVEAQFGVDNGIFVWLDGTFLNGWLAPGSAYDNEYQASIGSLMPGSHYLQILREDHGVATGYRINVTGDAGAPVPEPATMLLFGTGLAGLVGTKLKRKKK